MTQQLNLPLATSQPSRWGTGSSAIFKNMENRTTPARITQLAPNEVFVFGSNLAGIHGAGAAKAALRFWAKTGLGTGLVGQTYAIPTKSREMNVLPPQVIAFHVWLFLAEAGLSLLAGSDTVYLVTPIGCGLAGYAPEQIAPMFAMAAQLKNVHLPAEFWEVLNNAASGEKA